MSGKERKRRQNNNRTAEQGTLEEEVGELKHKMAVLRRADEIAHGSPDLDTVLTRSLDLAVEVAEADVGSLLLADPQTGDLEFKVVTGEQGRALRGTRLKTGEGIAGWVGKTGKSLIINDVHLDTKWASYLACRIGYSTRNILCTPLLTGDRTLGVIEVLNKRQGRDFDVTDQELSEVLAGHLATLIENSRLYQETVEKIWRLSALMETASVVSSSLDLNEVLDLVMNAAKDVVQAEASSVFCLDEEKRELYFETALGAKGEAAKQIRIPFGKGVVGWVAEKGEPLLVPDVSQDPRWFGQVDKASGFVTHSILAVPLKAKGRLIGVAEVLNKKGGGSFTQEDAELFQALARQAAVAMDNARLYRDLEDLFLSLIRTLVSIIDAKDPYTHGHSERVTQYALMVADRLGLEGEERRVVEISAILHDVGKMGLPDAILRKPDRLTAEEFAEVKRHPVKGAVIMSPIKPLSPRDSRHPPPP